ncbi:MAG: hypothetical protein VX944_06915 [Myxococcota bacterium]|nr:hypothetical protein [Myxococcota bacterium]
MTPDLCLNDTAPNRPADRSNRLARAIETRGAPNEASVSGTPNKSSRVAPVALSVNPTKHRA